ncbi:hypothetical protein JVT61DRAFT_3243 [Boletus reticuloceps]|uniref:Uncharacterized protein n=1 Tax=Boletus reticuloceps TaxID=495285 RepID=A0A8I2YNW6_9AGAM|nr:hypothetical protein JVT61DRAFT_3243 [Boletus reticuloceps]
MGISSEYDLVTSANRKITLQSLCAFLPSLHCNDITSHAKRRPSELADSKRAANQKEDTTKSLRVNLRARDANSSQSIATPIAISLTHMFIFRKPSNNQLAASRRAVNDIVKSLHANLPTQDAGPNEKTANLGKTAQQIRRNITTPRRALNQEGAAKSLHANRRTRGANSNSTVAYPEKNPQQLRTELADSQNKINPLQILRAHERKHQCEVLYTEGRVVDAVMSLLELTNTMSVEDTEKHNEALSAYFTALWLSPTTTSTLLVKWTSMVLIDGTVDKALSAATKFRLPRFVVYQAICDALEGDVRVMEAVECFRRMQKEPTTDTNIQAERSQYGNSMSFRVGTIA